MVIRTIELTPSSAGYAARDGLGLRNVFTRLKRPSRGSLDRLTDKGEQMRLTRGTLRHGAMRVAACLFDVRFSPAPVA